MSAVISRTLMYVGSVSGRPLSQTRLELSGEIARLRTSYQCAGAVAGTKGVGVIVSTLIVSISRDPTMNTRWRLSGVQFRSFTDIAASAVFGAVCGWFRSNSRMDVPCAAAIVLPSGDHARTQAEPPHRPITRD